MNTEDLSKKGAKAPFFYFKLSPTKTTKIINKKHLQRCLSRIYRATSCPRQESFLGVCDRHILLKNKYVNERN